MWKVVENTRSFFVELGKIGSSVISFSFSHYINFIANIEWPCLEDFLEGTNKNS